MVDGELVLLDETEARQIELDELRKRHEDQENKDQSEKITTAEIVELKDKMHILKRGLLSKKSVFRENAVNL